jgi:hypothetical protein
MGQEVNFKVGWRHGQSCKSPALPFSAMSSVCILSVRRLANRSVLAAGLALCLAAFSASSAAGSVEVKLTGQAQIVEKQPTGFTLKLEQASGRATLVFDYPADQPLDLSASRDLALKVRNHSSVELDFFVVALSDLKASIRYRTQGRLMVGPNEQHDLRVLLTRPALPRDHPHVVRLGNIYATPWGHQRHWQHADAAAIVRVTARVDWRGARPGETFEIGSPFGLGEYSVDPAKLDTLDLPLVDDWGQTRSADWPGKLASAEELLADASRDLELIAASRGPREGRTRFGGHATGPGLEATGFFRVEKISDKWWFVDPEGQLFWSLGVNTAGNASETRVRGREELFPASVRGSEEVRFLWENIRRKHGDDTWKDRHVDLTLARMFDWGINTIGAWSMPDLMAARRAPYTLIVHVDTQGFGSIRKIPDPFSDAFKNSLEQRLSRQAAEHADSPWLLGVFVDNELDWKNGNELVEEIIKSPAWTPARRAFVEFLQSRHGELEALNSAWGSDHASWEAIRPRPAGSAPAAYQADLRDFLNKFAEAYFTACRDAMRRHFPNHLYLGCRFHVFHPVVTAAASRFCDVISVNVYRYEVSDFAFPVDEDRPWIIGEFHFGARDEGLWGVGLAWAADSRNQADLAQAYLSEALRHRNLVGAHWFQWSNQVATGRYDGENFGVGLVTVVDRPVTSLVDAFRKVSDELYSFRLQPRPTRIGTP